MYFFHGTCMFINASDWLFLSTYSPESQFSKIMNKYTEYCFISFIILWPFSCTYHKVITFWIFTKLAFTGLFPTILSFLCPYLYSCPLSGHWKHLTQIICWNGRLSCEDIFYFFLISEITSMQDENNYYSSWQQTGEKFVSFLNSLHTAKSKHNWLHLLQ